jgi:hypothetical protein
MALWPTYYATLAFFDFVDEPMRLWDGVGVIDIDGYEWQGSGQMGSISPIKLSENDTGDKLEFGLSGVTPTIVALAQQSEARVRGRSVWLYLQTLSTETLQPVGAKRFLTRMVMDRLAYKAHGPSDRTVRLTSETIWTSRNSAAYSFWSDRDQKARYPGDRGAEFIPKLVHYKAPWPTF